MLDRILSRLERRLRFMTIPNLGTYLAILMAAVYVLSLVSRGSTPIGSLLVLDMDYVLRGQVWRLVTFLLVLPSQHPIWMAMNLMFYWYMANALEGAWGSFKFNVYYLLGTMLTIIAAILLHVFHMGGVFDGQYLHTTLLLAFGTMFPSMTIMLFGIIPVRAWMIAALAGALLAYKIIFPASDVAVESIALGVAVGNYLIFFGPQLYRVVHGLFAIESHKTKHADVLRTMRATRQNPLRVVRSCKICGVTDEEGADLRVCVCQAVCHGKPTVYCLEHARSHQKKSDVN